MEKHILLSTVKYFVRNIRLLTCSLYNKKIRDVEDVSREIDIKNIVIISKSSVSFHVKSPGAPMSDTSDFIET